MKGRVTYCIVTIAAMILSCSCRKEIIVPQDEENSRDFITFYVKSTPTAATKALIEDTDDLIDQAPPIYVTDLSDNSPAFDNESVSHSGSGIWRSDKTWNESKTYSFSAYVASPSPNSTATDSRGGLTVTDNGGIVTVSQPKNYSTDKNVWADYLLSYRLNVNGADRPVVALELERVTTAVELYMTRSANMEKVIVEGIEFRNVATSSRFSLDYQATPDDTEGPGGTKHRWANSLYEDSRTDYTYTPANGIQLPEYDETAGRFAAANRVMNFLTVQQTAVSGTDLYVRYRVLENGSYNSYEAVFNLMDYSPRTWNIGHKVKYYISVDSSIELVGIIQKWEEVDFIEGVLLPK